MDPKLRCSSGVAQRFSSFLSIIIKLEEGIFSGYPERLRDLSKLTQHS